MPVANRESPLVPNFEIIINGSPLPVEAKLHVISLTIDHDVNLPGMFTLELTDSDSQDEETTWINDEELFAIGNVVEVKLGYADDLETLIIGEITAYKRYIYVFEATAKPHIHPSAPPMSFTCFALNIRIEMVVKTSISRIVLECAVLKIERCGRVRLL